MKHTITIQGEELIIAMNLATEITYEQITDKPFDARDIFPSDGIVDSFAVTKLAVACIIANNPDSNIDDKFLLYTASRDESKLIIETVITAMFEWLNIPNMAEEHIPAPDEEDKKERKKNA